MKQTIKSSRVIILNSIVMLSLIAFLIVQNIYFLDKNNSTLSNIDKKFNRKVDVVMLMSKVVRERSLYMVTMFLSDDAWERDEIFTKFHKLKLDFLKLNNELNALVLAENENTQYQKIVSILDEAEAIQIDIVERIQSGSDTNIHEDISKIDLPIEREILTLFDSLVAVIKNNANRARNEAKKEYQEIIKFIALIAVIILLLAIYLTKKSLTKMVNIEIGLIQKAETLSWDATHDALTNVYNRRWLEHKFELLNDNDMDNKVIRHSLLYIDLDEFKPINDNYGHVVGDSFLCGITRELEQCIRQNDTLARMGGDEFAILLENCGAEKASSIAECLILRVKNFSLDVEGDKVGIAGCSIGIDEIYDDNIDFSETVKHADSACYKAKNNGKNRFYVFSPSA